MILQAEECAVSEGSFWSHFSELVLGIFQQFSRNLCGLKEHGIKFIFILSILNTNPGSDTEFYSSKTMQKYSSSYE